MDFSATAVGRGREGNSPDRSLEVVYEGDKGVERAHSVLNICSNERYITMRHRGCQEVFRTHFLSMAALEKYPIVVLDNHRLLHHTILEGTVL
jgi:hypothetical protein